MFMSGSPQIGWLSALKASSLNCSARPPEKTMFFRRDKSMLKMPGPMTMLRPALP